MSLLSPWFLAGLALLAGPIVAHLIRRATKDRVPFSTLRFLSPSTPRLDRRSRIQHPLLLALRCLVVALLALGFARPYLRETALVPPASGAPRTVAIVLDTSGSMQRGGLWDDARDRVREVAGKLSANDRLIVLTAEAGATTLLSANQWLQTLPADREGLLDTLLDAAKPTWGPSHLDHAIESALDLTREVNETADVPGDTEIVVVSDLAAGSRLAGLAGMTWPADTLVRLESIASAGKPNIGLQWLGWGADQGDGAPARVRLVADSKAGTSAVTLQLRAAETGAAIGEPIALVVPAGGTQVALIAVPANAPDALRLDLTANDDDFDNRLWLMRDTPRVLPVHYFGEAVAGDAAASRFYIEAASAAWRDPVPEIVPFETSDPAGPPPLMIVARPLNVAESAAVRDRLAAGGFALVLAHDATVLATAAELVGESGWQSGPPARRNYTLFGRIDFTHPLFAPFADPHFSDFSRIRFWQPRAVVLPADSAATVVARFDDDQVAVIEAAVGAGRVVVWPGDWKPAASQWILSTKFVPWLQALGERAAGGVRRAGVGDFGNLARTGVATLADLEPVTGARGEPGIYRTTGERPHALALNLPAAESLTDSLPLETMEQLGLPLEASISALTSELAERRSAVESATALEGRQQVWRWLLLLVAILLIAESILSLTLARRQPVPTA